MKGKKQAGKQTNNQENRTCPRSSFVSVCSQAHEDFADQPTRDDTEENDNNNLNERKKDKQEERKEREREKERETGLMNVSQDNGKEIRRRRMITTTTKRAINKGENEEKQDRKKEQ